MKNWWTGLTLREQLLIGAAGALLAILIVWYGIVSPLLTARADARLDRERAASDLAQVERLGWILGWGFSRAPACCWGETEHVALRQLEVV